MADNSNGWMQGMGASGKSGKNRGNHDDDIGGRIAPDDKGTAYNVDFGQVDKNNAKNQDHNHSNSGDNGPSLGQQLANQALNAPKHSNPFNDDADNRSQQKDGNGDPQQSPDNYSQTQGDNSDPFNTPANLSQKLEGGFDIGKAADNLSQSENGGKESPLGLFNNKQKPNQQPKNPKKQDSKPGSPLDKDIKTRALKNMIDDNQKERSKAKENGEDFVGSTYTNGALQNEYDNAKGQLQDEYDKKNPIKSGADKLKKAAIKEGTKGAAVGGAGFVGGKIVLGAAHNVASAGQSLLSHMGGMMSGLGQGIMHAGGAAIGGVKSAIGAVGGVVSNAVSSVGATAGTAAAVGTSTGVATVVGAPVATVAVGVSLLFPAFTPIDNYNPKCQNADQAAQSQTYTANYKLTGSQVMQDIEKWCAKNKLDAAQTAAILGSAQQESTMGQATTNLLGWSNSSGTNADHSHDTSNVSAYLDNFVHNIGKFSGQHGKYDTFLKYQKDMKGKSPADCEKWWGTYVEVCADWGSRIQFAEGFYKMITSGGGVSSITTAIDNTSITSMANKNTCSSDHGDGGGSDAADGTGSIKEDPGDSLLMWNTNNVPSDVKPFVHSPTAVGMKWGSNDGWANQDSNGQCVPFASSYFDKIWKFPAVVKSLYGHTNVDDWHSKYGGTISHTPHAGDLVSAQPSVTPLTAGNSAGHTFVILHVLKNGDAIFVQQNFPAMASTGFTGSGADVGKPNTWNYGILSHKFIEKYNSGLTFLTPDKKYKLNWGK